MRTKYLALLLLAPMTVAACVDQDESASNDGDVLAPYRDLLDRVFNAADPAAEYAKLTADEKLIVDRATQPYGDLDTTTEMAPAAADAGTTDASPSAALASFSGCWALHITGKAKAFFGNTLYTYWQNTNVCVTRGRVTNVWVTNKGGETSTPGWRIAHAPTSASLNVGWEGRGKAQYYFVFGIGGWDIQHPSDCLQGRLNADGSHYRVLTSCDLYAR